ncbi:hypothetical protein GDO86_019873 [Hymenochirus boettgeri]|uniref:C-type lectin domain-containing protein n=1 Tax=Hymenochirus boettgeri TaxID=247094 RepID=A0A8T2IFR5_9PIPI|nr:hypothetical protein GDO86_019873 [Hymenochirus boettgeri]
MDRGEAGAILSYINRQKPDASVWIGLTDPRQNGRWIWSDNSINNHQQWAPRQPDNDNQSEYCVELRKERGFLWNDVDCNIMRHYLCKFKA